MDLIYIDPPFFTHKQYEVVWGDEAEVRSFEDRWEGGIEHYIGWMKPRVQLMWEILKPTGSFYLHCDWHANAHLRIMLDEIFDAKNFRNEIIWQRTFAHGGGSVGFSRVHDSILFYTKSEKFLFNRQHVPYSESYIKNFFRFADADGRRYQLVILTGPGSTKNDYEWKGKRPTRGRHWAYKKEKMEELEKEGRLVYSKTGIPRVKQYIDEKQGTLVTDLWIDIPVIHSQSRERLGYPTQKPEALLERIMKVSSNKNDLILDPFCGCGTTVAVAQKLGRKWIGIDISPTAVKTITSRLDSMHAIKDKDFVVVGMPKTVDELKKLKPFEFQNWVIDEMGAHHSRKKVGDMGLDGYVMRSVLHGEAGIQVKQSDGIGRNVIDNFVSALQRAKYNKGFIIAFSFGKGAHEEVARLKNEGNVDIKLVNVEDLLYKKKPID